jgi:hypothetical protein
MYLPSPSLSLLIAAIDPGSPEKQGLERSSVASINGFKKKKEKDEKE